MLGTLPLSKMSLIVDANKGVLASLEATMSSRAFSLPTGVFSILSILSTSSTLMLPSIIFPSVDKCSPTVACSGFCTPFDEDFTEVSIP